jgi:hypothetical protein
MSRNPMCIKRPSVHQASQAEAAAEARLAAKELHDQGVPVRDIGRALGVSYQRAHQLAS